MSSLLVTTTKTNKATADTNREGKPLVMSVVRIFYMAWIDDKIFRYKGNDLLVMLYLITHMDENGVCMVGIRTLATEIGITYQSVRETLKRLQPQHITTHITTHQGTYFNILGFSEFTKQTKKTQRTLQRTIQTPIEPSKKSLKERQHDFGMSLIPYLLENGGRYPKGLIREFYDYWSEPNQAQTKMRWEMQKTWSVSGRLATWANNNNKFKNNNYGRETITDKMQRTAENADEFINRIRAKREANLGNGDSQ